jgi:hypothetical protein
MKHKIWSGWIVLFVSSVLFACNGNVSPQSTPPDPNTPPPVTQPGKPPPVIDPTIPRIIWSAPENDAKSVPLNSKIRLEFSLPMNPESVQVTMSPYTDLAAGTWLAEDRFQELEFSTPKGIQPETTYTLKVVGSSQAGKKLVSELRYSTGSTKDATAPYLISSLPQNGESEVSADTPKMMFTFNEPVTMDYESASLTCNRKTGCGGFGNVSWSADRKTLMLKFQDGLRGPAQYVAEITVKDISGNASAKSMVAFQTEADQRPILMDFQPQQKEFVDKADAKLTVYFDKPMNKESLKTSLSGSVFLNKVIRSVAISSVLDGPGANSYIVTFAELFESGSHVRWFLGRPTDLEGRTVADLWAGEFFVDLPK